MTTESGRHGSLSTTFRGYQQNDYRNHVQSSSLVRPGKEDKTVAFALYDFNPSNEDQISFKKGDRMTLLDTRSQIDWWLAQHAQSGQTGYVPKNYITTENEGTAETPKWMAGHITRDQAEYWVLQDKLPLGAFLIREKDASLNKNIIEEFVLTVRDAENQPGGNVKHYRIQQNDVDGFLFIRPSTQTFKTLEELVEHYSSHMDGLCCKLTMAALRPSSSKARTAISWEIPRSHLQLMKQIGSGNFGEVWFGKWRGVIEAAIKCMKLNTMSPQSFLEEAAIMKQFDHPSLVKLYGICSREEPLYIVTEFMENGALESYLRGEEGQKLRLRELIDISAQIANGMAYLENKNFVHRDLAARNILVGEKSDSSAPIVKIADFGLARALLPEGFYEASVGHTKFPLKWTAPEAALSKSFTVKSDVWSFGVLLYEVFTKGLRPYPTISTRDVVFEVENGYRMPRPAICPQSVYDLMLKCWAKFPDDRPSFEFLHYIFHRGDL